MMKPGGKAWCAWINWRGEPETVQVEAKRATNRAGKTLLTTNEAALGFRAIAELRELHPTRAAALEALVLGLEQLITNLHADLEREQGRLARAEAALRAESSAAAAAKGSSNG